MRRTLASLILLLAASPLWGQIVVPAKVQLGEPIEATTPFEAKAYQWESDSKLKPHADGRGTFVWARPGKHSITLIAVTESYEIKKWLATFEVVDAPLPPTPVTLRELAGADADKLAEYFNVIAGQITSTTTAAKFWAGYEASMKIAISQELDTALRTRLTTALLDLPTLADSLRSLASEFKDPGPEPPVPPEPKVAPIPEPGLHVLIVEETADRLKLPEGQRDIITATGWRESWEGKGGMIRMRDPSDEQPNDLAKWNTAMDRPRSGLPWVIISNGVTGYEGPLPDSLTEWEALLSKYGG
jgi:hypothetical protein